MANYANQKTFTINRTIPSFNDGKQFLSIYAHSLAHASRELTPVGFKLYLYLASNKDKYIKDYSPQDFANVYGVSYEAARKAPQNLEENGYLVHLGANKYEFFEEPQEPKEKEIIFEPERRSFNIKGKLYTFTYEEFLEQVKGFSPERINKIWNSGEVVE